MRLIDKMMWSLASPFAPFTPFTPFTPFGLFKKSSVFRPWSDNSRYFFLLHTAIVISMDNSSLPK